MTAPNVHALHGIALALLLSCAEKWPGSGTGPGVDSGALSDGGAPTDAGTDADGDGHGGSDDCDDGDATVHPGAPEQCDGIDQDCDGVADNDVINDGAGCLDPGWPEWGESVDIVHITLRTGSNTFDDSSDEDYSVCLGADRCLSVDKNEWDEFELGALDVSAHEDLSWSRADLDQFTIGTTNGSNQWEPTGFMVSLDGQPLYCREPVALELGDADDELLSWTDPDGLTLGCDTVFETFLTHGPMVGGVGTTWAKLWVRTDATRHVQVYVAADEAALADAQAVHHAYPAASDDFAHTVTVQGLSPATRYVYRVDIADSSGTVAVGEVHDFHTAPDGAGVHRFAFGSCSKEDEQPVFGAIAAWDPDLFVFAGDNHYGNTDELSDLRQFYRWAHERPLRRDVLTDTPILATWDDHDYVGNNSDGSAEGKDTALRVFTEYWANPSYGLADAPGTFFRHRWGDVELFLLDVRYHRGVDGTYLGAAQHAWLLAGLADSDATFKLLVSGGQWTPYGSSDTWAAWDDDRNAVFQAIVDNGVEGVVLLSGDIHRFELREITPASGGYVLPEISSSPLAYPLSLGCGDDDDEPDRLLCLEGFDGFVGLTIDTTLLDPTVTAHVIDTSGGVQAEWVLARSALGF